MTFWSFSQRLVVPNPGKLLIILCLFNVSFVWADYNNVLTQMQVSVFVSPTVETLNFDWINEILVQSERVFSFPLVILAQL